jgi:HK97 family phage portal protein
MSDGMHGPVWWLGLDSGGGASPIGPNGPWGFGASAAGLPIVTRATSLIVSPLTAAPFRQVDLGDGSPQAAGRFLTDPMLLRPDARFIDSVYPAVAKLPRSEFWGAWIRSALWWGVGGFICQEDLNGQPLAGTMRLVDPALLSTARDDNGTLVWSLSAGTGRADEDVQFDRDGYVTLGTASYRLVTLRNPHSPVDTEGRSMGVFEMNPQAFGISQQVQDYTSGTFRSGVPAGYLKVDGAVGTGLTPEGASELRTNWLANHGGDRRSIAVLNAYTSFVPLNLSPVDAALGEVKRLSIADVAYAFALSPDNLGVSLSGSATYSNVRDHFQDLKDFGLAAWIAAVEDVLTALLAGSAGVRVNLDGFANPPASERFASYKLAVDMGLLTLEECRALEGLAPTGAVEPPVPAPGAVPAPANEPALAPAQPAQRHLHLSQAWR